MNVKKGGVLRFVFFSDKHFGGAMGCGMRDLDSPDPGIKPVPPVLGTRNSKSLDHEGSVNSQLTTNLDQ